MREGCRVPAPTIPRLATEDLRNLEWSLDPRARLHRSPPARSSAGALCVCVCAGGARRAAAKRLEVQANKGGIIPSREGGIQPISPPSLPIQQANRWNLRVLFEAPVSSGYLLLALHVYTALPHRCSGSPRVGSPHRHPCPARPQGGRALLHAMCPQASGGRPQSPAAGCRGPPVPRPAAPPAPGRAHSRPPAPSPPGRCRS